MKKIGIALVIILIVSICIIAFLYSKPKIAILTYHIVGTLEDMEKCEDERTWTITVDSFKEQLEYLKKHNYKTITMEEFYKWKKGEIKLPRKSVLITFDDGKLSNYNYAFPLLKEYNMNAVVFVVGAFVENGKDKWNGNLTDYMSKNLLEECKEKYPNIEFCSHSYNLHEIGSIENNTQEVLIEDAKTFNKNIFETKYYAYPFGAYNDKMKNALEENNFNLAFRFGPERKDYRKASRSDLDYEIPRLNFSYNTPMWKFKLRLISPF